MGKRHRVPSCRSLCLLTVFGLLLAVVWPAVQPAPVQAWAHGTAYPPEPYQVLPSWWQVTLSSAPHADAATLTRGALPAWWPPARPLSGRHPRALAQAAVESIGIESPIGTPVVTKTLEPGGSFTFYAVGYTDTITALQTVTWTLSANIASPQVSEGTSVTLNAGTVAGSAVLTATLQDAPAISATARITVTPGAPYRFAFDAPGSAVAGSGFVVTMTAQDAYSNKVTDWMQPVALTVDQGSIVPALLAGEDFGAGVWSDSITLTQAGNRIISATSGAVSGTAQIGISAGSLSTITVTPNPVTVTVGLTQTFTATGTDRYGNAVPVAPSWATNGGIIKPGPSATSVFTAPTTATAGRLVTATQDGVTGTAGVNIVAGSLANVSVTPDPATVTVGLTQIFTATGTDRYGNAVPVAPSWATNGGIIDSGPSETTVFTASTTAMAGRLVTATQDGVTGTAEVDIVAGSLTTITVTPDPATVTVGLTETFTALGTDRYRNPVAVSPVWATNGGAIEPGPSDTSVFTAWITATAGRLVTATQAGITGTAQVTLQHGPVHSFYFSPTEITTQTAGADFYLWLEARDEYTNLATRYAGTPLLTDSTGTIQPGLVAFDQGVWTGVVSITQATQGVVISVTDGMTDGHSNAFTVLPADLDYFTIQDSPSEVVAGEVFSDVVVTAYDRYDNVKTNYTGTLYFTCDDILATLPFTSDHRYTYTDTNSGSATFDGFVLRTAGTRYVTPTNGTVSGTSAGILVQPAALDHLALSGYPGEVVAGESWVGYTVVVTAYDVYDNLKTNYTGTVHFDSSDMLFDAPDDYTFTLGDSGSRDFPGSEFAFYHTHQQTLSVTDLETDIVETSSWIDVAPGDLDYFVIDNVTSPQTAGTPFNVTIRAFDAWDNVKTDYAEQPALTDSTGTIAPDHTGCASPWTTGACVQNVAITRAQASVYITATDPGGVYRASNSFAVNPAPLARIRINSAPSNGGYSYGYPVEVGAHTMTIYMTYTVWAAGYDAYENYRGDISVAWGLGGVLETGEIAPNPGISAVLTPAPVLSGTGFITARHVASGFEDSTGDFTVQAPWFVIEKTGPAIPVPAGTENVKYEITFSNVGNADAREVQVTEDYDDNVIFRLAVPEADDPDGTIWTYPSLGQGDPPETILVFVDVAGSLVPNTILTNVVEIVGSRMSPITALVTTVVTSVPDLTVLVSDLGNDPVNAGESFALRIEYTNDGSAPVNNVVLTLTLDSHLTYQQAGVLPVIPPTPNNGNTGRWELGTVQAGQTKSFFVWVKVDDFMVDQDSLVNSAIIFSDQTSPAYDTEVTLVNAPILALTKLAARDPAVAFSPLTYTLVYSNLGHAATSALYITDILPAGTQFSRCQPAPCTATASGVTWQPGSLAARSQSAVTLIVAVDRNLDTGTVLTNRARLRVFDTPAYSASAQITTSVVSSPSLQITIDNEQDTVEAGDRLEYILGYINEGSGKAYNTRIIATVPSPALVEDVTCWPVAKCKVQGGYIIYEVGTLVGGEFGDVRMSMNVRDPLPAGLHTVLASASISTDAPGDPPAGNNAQDADEVVTRPDLSVSVGYEDIKPYPDKQVIYTLYYNNAGHIATDGVVITAVQPSYTLFDASDSDPGWMADGDGEYRYQVGALDYEDDGELLFVLTLTTTNFFVPPVTDFDASFSISDSGISGDDAEPDDNVFLAPMGVPNLVIEDVVADASIWQARPGYLTVTVRNSGSGPAYGLAFASGDFALDIFVNPDELPPAFPIDKFGTCFIYLEPLAPGLTTTAVISFTTLDLESYPSGLCGIANVRELWLKVDNWSRVDQTPSADFGLVAESDEYDNVFGPLVSPHRVFLPLAMKP